MSFTQIVGKLDESRNLSTSTWTVSDLKGDQFDYSFIAFCDSASTGNNALKITFNSDSGGNYDNNRMQGQGTTKSQADTINETSINLFRFCRNDSSRNSLAGGVITGDSSQDRVLKVLFSTGEPRICQGFHAWTDNVNELDSITFTAALNASAKYHIVVFEVPKVGNDDQWELINTLSWSASSTEQSFTDLEGDTDKQYLVAWDADGVDLKVEPNNDGSSNITREMVYNSGSAFVALNSTTEDHISVKGKEALLLNSESGTDRTAFGVGGGQGTAKQHITASWYRNTADEITSLHCTPTSSVTATAKLFRRKNPKVPADIFRLPFEFVQKIDVDSADFTAGDSFTGLESDKVLMYRLEFTGVQTNIINLLSNGDTGASDYAYQYLRGIGTAEAAGIDTAHNVVQLCDDSNGDSCNAVMYIYPRSGEYRPMVGYAMNDEDEILLRAAWRLDSATEITSLKVLTSATGQITGTFTLSAIYL